jgi:hypothetical protein
MSQIFTVPYNDEGNSHKEPNLKANIQRFSTHK